MTILGTAGHVDHGKSTLIRALTGIDPDRLPEEKRRGMTIELGFAHLDLPKGDRVGVVDVPGHTRFLHNMLAGVHGMDAVVLVVAADEGVMPQTREHLDIIGLLGVHRVVVALTKIDLAEPEMAELAAAEVRTELRRRLVEAEVVSVSAITGEGLAELLEKIDGLVGNAPIPDLGRPRLPIDRVFVQQGFGVVATGSLVDGSLRPGQEVELVPGLGPRGRPSTSTPSLITRVRALEQYGAPVDIAAPGSRLAVNLHGVERVDVRRGQVLAPPGSLQATVRVDLRLQVLQGAHPVHHNEGVMVYGGTAEAPARVVLLEGEHLEAGGTGWAQLRLAYPMAIRDGDRLVIRRPSLGVTVAGGVVIDVDPAPQGRRHSAAVASLERRLALGGRLAEELAKATSGAQLAILAKRLGRDTRQLELELAGLVEQGIAVRAGDRYYASQHWHRLELAAVNRVESFHSANPLRAGIPRASLKSVLAVDAGAIASIMGAILNRGTLVEVGTNLISLPGYEPHLTPAQRQTVDSALLALRQQPFGPPTGAELALIGLSQPLQEFLEDCGRVVRIAPGLLMLTEAVEDATRLIRAYLSKHETLTVAEARDVLGSSRRIVVPLLEYLDATHVTRRHDQIRRLSKTVAATAEMKAAGRVD